MARRLFRGNAFSENDWPYVDQDSCTWADIPGTNRTVQMQFQNGIPFSVMRAFAADFHAHVQPLFNADCCCWTPDNSVSTSNHPGGTAMDLRWETHPFQVRGTFTPTELANLLDLLKFYDGMIFWAGVDWPKGGWGSPIDEMHFQMDYNTYDRANDRPYQKCFDWVARYIRADGFSTYKRGNAAMPDDAALILSRATGLDLNRATEILPTMQQGLREAGCTTPLLIAMFIAQTGHESVDFKYTEEIAKNGRYAPYIGRTWIQITWDYNYRDFSEWCFDRGLVPSPDYFVLNYRELADLKWAGLGAAWYWTVQRPMNDLVDAGDSATWNGYRGFEAVTAAINGGLNGLDDRRLRYNRALAVGDDLTHILNGEDDFLSALSPDEQRELLTLARVQAAERYASRSMYATGPDDKDTPAGRSMSAHAFGWDGRVESSAYRGEAWAIELLAQAAAGVLYGVIKEDGTPDQFLVDHARAVLNDLETNTQVLQGYLAQKGARL